MPPPRESVSNGGSLRLPGIFELDDGNARSSWWRNLRRGLIVEVGYARGAYALKVNKDTISVDDVAHFREGEYCLASVVRRQRTKKRAKPRYVLKYRDGPFDEETHQSTGKKLEKGTTFVGVPRDCIVVTYEDQRRYYPLALFLISAVQVGAFYYFSQRKPGKTGLNGPVIGPESLWFWITGPFPGCRDGRKQPWRLISYQLAHSGYAHLISNVVLQILYGLSIEIVHGHFKLLGVYNMGVCLGALTCAFSDIHKAVVGASGGLYTLIGLHTADVVLNMDAMGDTLRKLARSALCLLVPATDIAVYLLVLKSKDVSYSAHAGGWIAGFLFGLVFLQPVITKPVYSIFIRPIAALLGLIFVFFSVSWWATHYPPSYFVNGNIFKLSKYGARDDNPACCWQLLTCDDIHRDDYSSFNCHDNKDLTWPWDPTETHLDTCSLLLDAISNSL